ncbi:uncharacterized protein FIBRA_07722 [Fibroporia radiculosa]|uniref:F-box domain-containing protein n=1 Tax=Fibroporia radiculosa TaxID=599839 RepID=J4H4S5_9APHY|nr:uncharacterized protein FIBRA_07722 [Fibroporia radiculosa]CCM05499.1 predicted protein [Fibroporia radiculosa]
MDVAVKYSPQNAHSVADRYEVEDVATVGAGEYPPSAACSQLWDICPVVSSQLPTELWEHIIDFIADDHIYHMRRLGQFGNFGSFAVRMVQKLPRVDILRLSHCQWEAGQLHAQVFLHVTLTFGSVTKLELFDVSFPSAVVFWRLLSALPRLSSLDCRFVEFKRDCHVLGAVRLPGSLRLDVAHLDDCDGVFDFLTSISVRLRHLICHGRHLRKHLMLLFVSSESLLSLEVRDIHEASPLNLTPAFNLRVLAFDGELKDIAKAAGFLSRTSLPKLVEVTISSRPFPQGTLVSVENILNGIDDDCFQRMDHVLSDHQFLALRKVTLLLRCSAEDSSEAMDVISEASWRTQLSSRLPALHASGRLLSSVTVIVCGPGPRLW